MLIYLASAYSHPDPAVREERYKTACFATAKLMATGKFVFSPIAMTHGVCLAGKPEEFQYEYWEKFDRFMIDLADEFWVLMMDGWRESKGIKAELIYATERLKPIRYV